MVCIYNGTIRNVTIDVPQGCLLGSIFLLIFINDLPNHVPATWSSMRMTLQFDTLSEEHGRFTGVWFDSRISWHDHIQATIPTLSRAIYARKLIRKIAVHLYTPSKSGDCRSTLIPTKTSCTKSRRSSVNRAL